MADDINYQLLSAKLKNVSQHLKELMLVKSALAGILFRILMPRLLKKYLRASVE